MHQTVLTAFAAIQAGRALAEVERAMEAAGADATAPDGTTLLMAAVQPDRYGDDLAVQGMCAYAALLLAAGADAAATDAAGLTAHAYAMRFVNGWTNALGAVPSAAWTDAEHATFRELLATLAGYSGGPTR